jgi:hypothetical protein
MPNQIRHVQFVDMHLSEELAKRLRAAHDPGGVELKVNGSAAGADAGLYQVTGGPDAGRVVWINDAAKGAAVLAQAWQAANKSVSSATRLRDPSVVVQHANGTPLSDSEVRRIKAALVAVEEI